MIIMGNLMLVNVIMFAVLYGPSNKSSMTPFTSIHAAFSLSLALGFVILRSIFTAFRGAGMRFFLTLIMAMITSFVAFELAVNALAYTASDPLSLSASMMIAAMATLGFVFFWLPIALCNFFIFMFFHVRHEKALRRSRPLPTRTIPRDNGNTHPDFT